MNKTTGLWIAVIAMVVTISIVIYTSNQVNPSEDNSVKITREQQHIVAIEQGANPKIGDTTVSEDGKISADFVSHLPLVVIDTQGSEVPMTKEVTASQDVIYTGEDPYITGTISVIDNDDYVNSPFDEPAFSSKIKIKYRGNYSLNLDKKQYGIKLIDENGESKKSSILGMEENNDWILNISQLDESLIRNYLALNVGSALFEGTPECKYCEVFILDGTEYIYQGVYLFEEKIEKGNGRVELDDYVSGNKNVDYLLCRDREDDTENQISTYTNENGITSTRLSILYPDEECLDDYAFSYIQDDIDNIDRIIYSDDESVFSNWPQYIDTQSFVDYFLFNELFGNYDAGDNSTYMYKLSTGKLCMGPVWDYDGAMDNGVDIANPEDLAFYQCPWFERLVTSREFMNAALDRYDQLTEEDALLSDEYLTDYVQQVSEYLGNAALRDRSRWASSYDTNIVHDAEDSDSYTVFRDNEQWESEVDRLGDYFVIKELYMKDSLQKLFYEAKSDNTLFSGFAVIMCIGFVCTVVLVRRKGMYK